MADQTPQQKALAVQAQKVKTIQQYLDRYRGEIAKAVPRHINPDRLARVALAAVSRDAKLAACTPVSLMRAVMQSAVLGLEIGVVGEAYLVPYKDEATFLPGYQGLIKLALQSKAVAAIQAGIVRPKDVFEYELGSTPYVKHVPHLYTLEEMPRYTDSNGEPTGAAHMPDIVAAYCVVKLPSGEFQATIMSKAEVDLIRARSRASSNGPWVTDYEQMATKTAIRRGLKYVPKTPELARAIETDDRREVGEDASDLFMEIPSELPGEDAKDVTPKPGSADQARAAMGMDKPAAPKPAAAGGGQPPREPGEEG